MAATCRLITTPTTRSEEPAWFMCTGVIDIRPTIAVWHSAMVTRASFALDRSDRHTAALPLVGA